MNPVSAIYTPQEMSEADFRSRFSVRTEILEELVQTAVTVGRNEIPRHVIIQGQRGQGKSSLLRMTYLRVSENKETTDWLVPVLFREELYGVGKLYKLWEHIADLLSVQPGLENLPDEFEAAEDDPHYEKDCYQILEAALRKHDICLLLLIDNIGELLTKFKKQEQQRLRKILSSTNRLRIIGASTVMLEQHFDQSTPFYQFFKMISLKGLNAEEALTLLRNLGDDHQKKILEEILKSNPGRIETLRRLTSGVPRTILLLFEILLNDNGDAIHDLESLLDRVTPLYKHRMDDLPTQQQEIVDAVALAWDAIGVKEIAKICRLPSKQVSAQLKQLIKSHIIHQEPTSTKNHLYRLEERFFNIWYLMRNGRARDRQRTLWLVRFLQSWCNSEELFKRAERHLHAIETGCIKPNHARFLTEALTYAGLTAAQEDQLIKATRLILPKEEQSLLPTSRNEYMEKAMTAFEAKEYQKAEEGFILAAKADVPKAMEILGLLYTHHFERYEDAERYFLMAIENGQSSSMHHLASLYTHHFKRYNEAERYFLMAVENGLPDAMYNLALLYEEHFKNYEDAERYYLMAIKNDYTDAINNLALLYEIHLDRREAAEKYFLMAVENGATEVNFNLALFYFEQAINLAKVIELSELAAQHEDMKKDPRQQLQLTRALLWGGKYSEAFTSLQKVLSVIDLNNFGSVFSDTLLFLAASGQTAYSLQLFEDKQHTKLNLQDHFKPVYYALLSKTGPTRADDFKRMGPELKETVNEILAAIKELEIRYFPTSN